jgi:hydroxyethylthiazole kinase-like uncharacterized protein yjeF
MSVSCSAEPQWTRNTAPADGPAGTAAHGSRDAWPEACLIEPALQRELPLPAYSATASKADRGKLLLVAGSRRLPGAALLAARAALRTGAGTVRLAAPAGVALALGIAFPELMVLPLPETPAGTTALAALDTIEAQYGAVDAAVVGPGLDEHGETLELARRMVVGVPAPLVVDATALPAGAATRDALVGPGSAPRVLTPHNAEMAALVGSEPPPEEGDEPARRETVARESAARWRVTLVLKGRATLVAAPEGRLYRNTAGSRGLGTAGSGDALAGAIGGLLAQGLDATAAAVWGVYLHARGGELAADELGHDGLLASDVVERLPRALRTLRGAVPDR